MGENVNAESKLLAIRELRTTIQAAIAEAEATFSAAEQAYQAAGAVLGKKRVVAEELDGHIKALALEVGQTHAESLTVPQLAESEQSAPAAG